MKSKLLYSLFTILIVSTLFIKKANANCGIPNGTNVTELTTTSAKLEWAWVGGASSYTVQWRKSGTTNWQVFYSGTASFDLTGLTAGASYEWQIQTNCVAGQSAFSRIGKFCTLVHPINIPTITNVHLLSPSAAMLSWTVIPGTCNYDLQWKTAASANWSTITGISAGSFNLSGLSPCNNYQFRVRTFCQNSVSDYSSPASFSTTGCLNANNTNANSTANDRMIHTENEKLIQFEMYPNPVRDNLKIEFESPSSREVKVSIFNIIGNNMVSSKSIADEGMNTISLNTAELPEGIYILELENNGDVNRSKFVIKK